MTIGAIKDREFSKFVESPTRPGSAAVEVINSNQSDQPVPVELFQGYESRAIYSELTLPALEDDELIQKTFLKESVGHSVSCSGENVAEFTIEINGSIALKKRTYYTEFNTEFNLSDFVFKPDDTIRILVENKRNSVASFNATLIFKERE